MDEKVKHLLETVRNKCVCFIKQFELTFYDKQIKNKAIHE